MNDKMFGPLAAIPVFRSEETWQKIEKGLRDNLLTITTKPLESENGWIPEVTVHSNAQLSDLTDIYLEIEVYDPQNNLRRL
jgi:hypothetical protein